MPVITPHFVPLQQLEDDEINTLSLMAVAGVAAEGQKYEEVRWLLRLSSSLQLATGVVCGLP